MLLLNDVVVLKCQNEFVLLNFGFKLFSFMHGILRKYPYTRGGSRTDWVCAGYGKPTFWLNINDLREPAYQLAEKYRLPHPFNRKHKSVGHDWLKRCMRRHPELSLTKPETMYETPSRAVLEET